MQCVIINYMNDSLDFFQAMILKLLYNNNIL